LKTSKISSFFLRLYFVITEDSLFISLYHVLFVAIIYHGYHGIVFFFKGELLVIVCRHPFGKLTTRSNMLTNLRNIPAIWMAKSPSCVYKGTFEVNKIRKSNKHCPQNYDCEEKRKIIGSASNAVSGHQHMAHKTFILLFPRSRNTSSYSRVLP
jgi:hypothetical protein